MVGLNRYNLRVMRDISSGIFSAMNVHRMNSRITARDMLTKIEKGDLDKDIGTIFSRIRGTEEYLKTPRQELQTMIDHYGPPAWFLTFSPNEWLWPDLKKFLLQVDKNFHSNMTISEMTSKDPVMTAVYINTWFKGIEKYILRFGTVQGLLLEL